LSDNNGREPDPEGQLFEIIERRAMMSLDADEPAADEVDVIETLSPDSKQEPDERDLTLGGYIEKHDRVPAFEGNDGQPYTVDIEVDPESSTDAARPFAAFLIFLRWAATGAGIMDHVESGDVALGATEEEARRGALDLSLYEVRAELDAAIERRRQDMES
jgi:hypothetical protein